MKIDIDTIFYIILSIIILVVSGLGSRRKKQALQMKQTVPTIGKAGVRGTEEQGMIPTARGPVIDPFERLEQILTGQTRYDTLEGESLEVLEDEEEAIIDDEEYIAAPVAREKPARQIVSAEKEDEQGKKGLDDLFGDTNEITRAIIYSELLPRKYI